MNQMMRLLKEFLCKSENMRFFKIFFQWLLKIKQNIHLFLSMVYYSSFNERIKIIILEIFKDLPRGNA